MQHDNAYGENSWSPLVDNPPRDSYHPAPAGLPYDSYNPKYNNNNNLDDFHFNKKNHRQRGSHAPPDMFTSATSNRPKKVLLVAAKPNPKRTQGKQKIKAKIRPAKRPINPTTRERDPDLSRELSPPPE